MKVKLIAGLVVVVALIALLIVREQPPEVVQPEAVRPEAVQPEVVQPKVVQPPATLTLATTTSTYDSGLLDVLLPPFEETYNVRVKVVSVGTGAAIRMGETGDADIVLVHHREGEDKFVAEGYGPARFDMMYNDFIIVGSEDDPAGIKGKRDVVQALKKVDTTKATFVSRGDDSGTHRRELSLWAITGITPVGKEWYFETGDGMGATLRVANEKKAYVLTDRGTFLAHKGRGDIALVIVVEGDERLFNPYGILPVSPEKHPHVNYELAMNLVRYFQSEKGREIIRTFGVEKFGQPLFIPYP